MVRFNYKNYKKEENIGFGKEGAYFLTVAKNLRKCKKVKYNREIFEKLEYKKKEKK